MTWNLDKNVPAFPDRINPLQIFSRRIFILLFLPLVLNLCMLKKKQSCITFFAIYVTMKRLFIYKPFFKLQKYFCMQISLTFNNLIKACSFDKKYFYNANTPDTNSMYISYWNPGINRVFNNYWFTNQLGLALFV